MILALRLFVVDLGALAEYARLEPAARPVAWRFLMVSEGERVAVDVDEKNHGVQIERSPYVFEPEEALRVADDNPDLGAGSAEPRLLRVPEARLTAVWFKSAGDRSDVVVPVHPSPAELQAFQPYPESAFMDIAGSIARRTIEQYQRFDRSSEAGS